jgi:hypothetical protein
MTKLPENTSSEHHLVLTLDGSEALNLRFSSLSLSEALPKASYLKLLRPAANIQYIAGAILYHVQELALHYSRVCNDFVRIRQLLPIKRDRSSFGNQSEPYYEAEALITAARRAYDALRYILWKSFGPGGKDTPSNFSKTIMACGKMPCGLKKSLTDSWKNYGVKMTAFRDCIQHYVPVTFDLQTASMERVFGDVWALRLRLPDNPECKSQKAFSFARDLDALTYCWELANEIFRISAEVFANIPLTETGAGNADSEAT